MKGDYIHLNYLALHRRLNPQRHIIATFRVGSRLPLKHIAQIVAAESSIGTWSQVKTMSQSMFKRLSAKVIAVHPARHTADIAYPVELFEPGNIPQLLSSVAGNVFSMKSVETLRLEDLQFPDHYVDSFPGPAFGVEGIRRKLRIHGRPIMGSIMKPKMGLTWKQHAHYAYLTFRGGIDLVKDDENLTSQSFNPFNLRVKATLAGAQKAEQETGSLKVCALNVTAPADEMLDRARLIVKYHGRCAMVDIVTAGFAGVQSLRNANTGLILHGHRAMHSAFTRDPKHGVSMLVLAKLSRLAGIDQLHVGSIVGKMEGSTKEVQELYKFCRQPWRKIKPMMPIASGGLHPGLVPALIRYLGIDTIMNFGGGIHGHPRGTSAGAQAVSQAVEATLKKIPLAKYARSHRELAEALGEWGQTQW